MVLVWVMVDTSAADETSYGVSYSSSVNGADVSVSYAAANTGAAITADALQILAASQWRWCKLWCSINRMAQNAQKQIVMMTTHLLLD
ncbi:MAG: hypothetical protein CM15mP117_10390 [Alphaproteobacteria bacterium]|nr:MAG: hypothetical protein CM15mP117_10390 [Alphaproteobacteria bacterium]